MLNIAKLPNIFKLFYRGFWDYKRQVVTLSLLGLVAGLFEGIGINSAVPLFSFAMGNNEGGSDFISKFIRKIFYFLGIDFRLTNLLVFICLLFILRSAVLLVCYYLKYRITSDYEEKTRNKLFANSLNANWKFLLTQKLGHLDTLIKNNIRFGGNFLEIISGLVMSVTSLLIYIIVALNISLPVTSVTIVSGVLIIYFLKPLISKTKLFSKDVEAINRKVAHHINENIIGMKTVKTMSVNQKVIERAGRYFKELRDLTLKVNFLGSVSDALLQPSGIIIICLTFLFFSRTKSLNLAVLVAIIYLVQRMFIYFQQLQSGLNSLSGTIPYVEKILDYNDQALKNLETDEGLKDFDFNKQFAFRDVHFSYDQDKPVLSGINFEINKGEAIGIIGPSGAGKTTIVDLILRLFSPDQGSMLLDGVSHDQISMKKWRDSIGYVSQDIFLMNDTIMNNIRFYNSSVTDGEIIEAAKMAAVYDFIDGLPEKFETIVGERGVLLSGGQRQRLIIARALARKPQLLVLDEATSALDNESEVQIQKVIEGLKNKLTVVVIAHRLTTIMNADKLLVLSQGKVIEEGSPQSLLKDINSYFYRTYNIRKI